MHVRRVLALAAVVVALLLAGCSDDPAPTPKMPESTSSSPTPTPTESETPEVESAEEFIRRWVEVEAEMENTGDAAEYRKLSAKCEACMGLADTIEGWYDAGGYVKWDGWRITRVTSRGGSATEFVVRVVSSPTEYKERAEGPVKSYSGGRGAHLLTLERREGSWAVTYKAMVAQ